jgi:hypothetical protein
MNYHIEPEAGNGKAKVVHHNHLKPAPCRPRDEEYQLTNCPSMDTQTTIIIIVAHKPRIHHQEKVTLRSATLTTTLAEIHLSVSTSRDRQHSPLRRGIV